MTTEQDREAHDAVYEAGERLAATAKSETPGDHQSEDDGDPILVVGIGASAGGLEALSEFFEALPERTGMAFIVVQHLAPDQKSHMAGLLGRRAKIPVEFATDGMRLRRNLAVVMPADRYLEVRDGRLFLYSREHVSENLDKLPIDRFFHTLATDQGHRAVGVVLSGTGSDGARGIRSIKEAGGLVVAQDAVSPKFDGMPRAAVATGLADLVARPGDMPSQIQDYVVQTLPVATDEIVGGEEELESLLEFLASETGIDFDLYKRTTVLRRIQRRIAVTEVEDLERYHALLRRSARETDALRNDLLIHVTSFFRDVRAWQELKAHLPRLVAECDPREGLRLWVAACSTGEEAYTLAICLEEVMSELGTRVPYKIFASDLDPATIEVASAGSYPSAIAADLPRDSLARFFEKDGPRYVVARQIRERIIFAQHDLIRDPPFTKMDAITCRNLLIYLRSEVQDRLLGLLQFSLRRNGLLMLGASENLNQQLDGFEVIDSRWKIFRCRRRSLAAVGDALVDLSVESSVAAPRAGRRPARDRRSGELVGLQQKLIEAALPPTAIVDSNRSMVQSYGDVSEFLRIPSGVPTLDVARMAQGELSMLLATGVRQVTTEHDQLVFDSVSYGPADAQRARVNLRRIETSSEGLPLVAIHMEKREGGEDSVGEAEPVGEPSRGRVAQLERELRYTRESLQATVEELETTNEELQVSNEELMSSNQELQSTNEQLQSVNEELHTMNGEFQAKIEDLTIANDDFSNLMETTSVGAVFLDAKLRIRRFTDALREVIRLVPGDIGRHITDFQWRVRGRDISKAAAETLADGQERAFVVHDGHENWFWMRVRPYSAIDSRVGGVVITCMDITAEHERERHYADLEAATTGVTVPIAIVDAEGGLLHVNRSFAEAVQVAPSALHGGAISEFADGTILQRLKECVTSGESWEGPAAFSPRPDGTFWATARISPVDEEQTPAQAVISLRALRVSPPETDAPADD